MLETGLAFRKGWLVLDTRAALEPHHFMKMIENHTAMIPIEGPVVFLPYLVLNIYLCLNIFTDRLDREHEVKVNSSLSWLLVPGPFKYSRIYVRFFKAMSWFILLVVNVATAAVLWIRFR